MSGVDQPIQRARANQSTGFLLPSFHASIPAVDPERNMNNHIESGHLSIGYCGLDALYFYGIDIANGFAHFRHCLPDGIRHADG
jgi:hypothetical protein